MSNYFDLSTQIKSGEIEIFTARKLLIFKHFRIGQMYFVKYKPIYYYLYNS